MSETPGGFTSLAWVARGEGGVKLEQVRYLEPAADEVVVQMVSASICHSDQKALSKGGWLLPPPMIPGHEGAGIVKRAGAAAALRFQSGQHVVLSYSSCGDCRLCRTARPAACKRIEQQNFLGKRSTGESIVTATSDGTKLGGLFFGQSSFSQLALVHMSSLVPVDLSREELKMGCVFSCGIQTGAGTIFNVCRPTPGSNILIFGCGGVGLAAVMAARLSSPGALIVVDTNAERLKLALELGATHALDANENIVERVNSITDGDMCDFALECVGLPALLKTGHDCLANCGMLVTIGGPKAESDSPTFSIRSHLNRSKIYRGTHQGDSVSTEAIPKMIKLWRAGQFPVDRLLKTYGWRDIDTALADMSAGTTIKPVLLFEEASV